MANLILQPSNTATVDDASALLGELGAAANIELALHEVATSQEVIPPGYNRAPGPLASGSAIPLVSELREQAPARTGASANSPLKGFLTDVGLRKIRSELQVAGDLLPYNEKAAYLDARERVPDLVDQESDPEAFLDCESCNVEKAAQHLVAYWNKRKQIFGARAFLPMTQTGEGALNRGDLKVLASYYFGQLPSDRVGRTVLCYDGSKLGKCSQDSRLRVAFYLFSVAAESEGDGCHLHQG